MPKITLRAARVNAGYSLVEAAKQLGIHHETLSKYERDSSHIPRSLFIKLEKLYSMPVEYIFFGNQSEFIRTKREVM